MMKMASKHLRQKAAALIEMVIVVPLLVMIIYGVVSAGRSITEYTAVVRYAYEGVRYAATVKSIPTGCWGVGCSDQSPTSSLISGVQKRMAELLTKRYGILENNAPWSSTMTVSITRTTSNPSYKVISITLRVPYKSLVSAFIGDQLTVTASAPSLFTDSE